MGLIRTGSASFLRIGATEVTAILPGFVPDAGVQIASFGALTLEGAGAYDAGVPLTGYDSLLSGSLDGYTPTITPEGRLAFSGAAGAPNGATIRCTSAGGPVDIQIVTEADTWSAATVTEMEAVNALGGVTLAGRTLRLRPGTYMLAGRAAFANRVFATTHTVASHDTVAYNHVTRERHTRVNLVFRTSGVAGAPKQVLDGATNMKFHGVTLSARYTRRGAGPTEYGIWTNSPVTNLEIENCWIKGNNDALGSGGNYRGLFGGSPAAFAARGEIGLRLYRTAVSHGSRMLMVSGPGRVEIRECELYMYSGDATQLGDENVAERGPVIIEDNYIHSPDIDKNLIIMNVQSGGYKSARETIVGLENQTRFVIAARATGSGLVERTLFALGAVDTTPSVHLRMIDGFANFIARDPEGAVVLDMTAPVAWFGGVVHNILISVDTTGTSRMHIWAESGDEDLPADEYEVTATAAGQTIRLAAGGGSVGATDVGVTTGAATWSGSIGWVALWQNVTANVADPAVRSQFYTPVARGLPTPDAARGLLGDPIVELYGSKNQWLNALNTGTSPTKFLKRGTNQSMDIAHLDAFQALPQSSTVVPSRAVSPEDWKINRNVVLAWVPGTQGEAIGDGQHFFLEDILGVYCYLNTEIRNNLSISSIGNNISVANPGAGSRVMFNTAMGFYEMQDPGQRQQPGILMGYQNVSDVFLGWTLDVENCTGPVEDYQTFSLGGNSYRVWLVREQNLVAGTAKFFVIKTAGSSISDDTFPIGTELTLTRSSGTITCTVAAQSFYAPPFGVLMAGNISVQADWNRKLAELGGDMQVGHNRTMGIQSFDQWNATFQWEGPWAAEQIISKERVMEMFATRPLADHLVQQGWDAYWNTLSPYDRTCDAVSIPSIPAVYYGENAVSDVIVPTGVPAEGVAIAAWGADGTPLECRLIASDDTLIADWTLAHLVLRPGQKFQVRRVITSVDGADYTDKVRVGADVYPWSITVADPEVLFETSFSDPADVAAWTQVAPTVEHNAGTGQMWLRNTNTSVMPTASKLITAAGLEFGETIRIEFRCERNNAVGQFEYWLGNAATEGLYANGVRLSNSTSVERIVELAGADELFMKFTHRSNDGTGLLQWGVDSVRVSRLPKRPV